RHKFPPFGTVGAARLRAITPGETLKVCRQIEHIGRIWRLITGKHREGIGHGPLRRAQRYGLILQKHKIMRGQRGAELSPERMKLVLGNMGVKIPREKRRLVVGKLSAEPDQSAEPKLAFNTKGRKQERLALPRYYRDGRLDPFRLPDMPMPDGKPVETLKGSAFSLCLKTPPKRLRRRKIFKDGDTRRMGEPRRITRTE